MRIPITLKVNGMEHSLEVRPHDTLLHVLRNELGLPGTNEGCGKGDCGACTVLMNGTSVNSCLVLAPEADGAEVTTIEGLAQPGRLHPVQQAFIDEGAVQCGFCTPGMVMTAVAFLDRNPEPTIDEATAAIEGNICRCTGYTKIVAAIMTAAKRMRKKTAPGTAKAKRKPARRK